jgi:hypothetical protein
MATALGREPIELAQFASRLTEAHWSLLATLRDMLGGDIPGDDFAAMLINSEVDRPGEFLELLQRAGIVQARRKFSIPAHMNRSARSLEEAERMAAPQPVTIRVTGRIVDLFWLHNADPPSRTLADTRKSPTATVCVQDALTEALIAARADATAAGVPMRRACAEFRRKHAKELGRTPAERQQKWDAISRTARRHK